METQIRRLLPRQIVDWPGSFAIEGSVDPKHIWRGCRVLDISCGGAGVEISNPDPDIEVGETLVLALRLRGEIRDTRARGEDRLRVGIQFSDMSGRERAYLDSLLNLQARW
ncbi:MAG: PilZ domain-containing protein [Acidimicrobiales bacterium]